MSTFGARLSCVASIIIVAAVTSGPYASADWPQFRGADSRGVADGAGFPDTWSEKQNVLWSQKVAGRGWSSPIVAGNRAFVTTVTRETGEPEPAVTGLYFGGNRDKPSDVVHEWKLLCFDLQTGKPQWERTLHKGKPQTSRHIKNSYASETPVTDGERVYVLFGDVGLYCVTVEGKPVWEMRLPPVKTRYDWGTASSPILHGDRLYFVSDNEQASYLMALDNKTGTEIFKIDRDEKSNWATPFVWQNAQRTEIITPGTGKFRSYDLDGNLLYEFGGGSSITIATPYTANGLLFVSSGYVLDKKRPIFAVRPGASGDISLGPDETSNQYVAWCRKMAAPYNPSTLVYNDTMYVLYDRGTVAAFDAKTGAEKISRRRIPSGRAFTASPWASDGKIYFLGELGTTLVYSAGDDFKLLHENKLPEDEALYMATPAVADGKLLIRSSKRLYCIGK